MSARRPRLPVELRTALEESGLPWRIDTGSNHYKLMVNDKLATILPYGGHLDDFHGRADKNLTAAVKRFIRMELGQ